MELSVRTERGAAPAFEHSRQLAVLTQMAIRHLGASALVADGDNSTRLDWRMLRIGDAIWFEKPADARSPRRIDCYQIADYRAGGEAFKIDPTRLVYSLRWRREADSPTFDLVLLQAEPREWISAANFSLLSELRSRARHAIDRSDPSETQPVDAPVAAAR